MFSQIATAAIETAINQYLKLDSEAFARLAEFQGKVIAIELKGLGLGFYLLPDQEGIQVMQSFDGEVDATIVGTPFALLRMKLDERGRDTLFQGDVEIKGDLRTGQAFNRLLESIDINWEEHLSHVVGDVVAHGIGGKLRDLLNWGKESGQRLRDDVADYLHEESRDLPVRDEVDGFMQQVDEIRSDVERLEMRVLRLKKKIHESGDLHSS